jgi:uncharacterized protein with HEPN domain
MRSDELYVRDMLNVAGDVIAFLAGYNRERFLGDRVMQRAILQALTELGEAANHVSPDLKGRYLEVPWDDARAFRNFAIHQYFAVSWEIVWDTATVDVVQLQPLVATMVAAEFPDRAG